MRLSHSSCRSGQLKSTHLPLWRHVRWVIRCRSLVVSDALIWSFMLAFILPVRNLWNYSSSSLTGQVQWEYLPDLGLWLFCHMGKICRSAFGNIFLLCSLALKCLTGGCPAPSAVPEPKYHSLWKGADYYTCLVGSPGTVWEVGWEWVEGLWVWCTCLQEGTAEFECICVERR